MKKLGCQMTEEEWGLFIKIADQDHSGEVDFEEFKLVWGTGVNNTKPSIAWVGGIPKSDKSIEEREAEVKEAFERRARARNGAVPAPDEAPHDESIVGGIEGFGEVLDVVIWDERDVGESWAKVQFKGVHAQALAMAMAGKEGAATIRGHELEVESWNQEKNNALAELSRQDRKLCPTWMRRLERKKKITDKGLRFECINLKEKCCQEDEAQSAKEGKAVCVIGCQKPHAPWGEVSVQAAATSAREIRSIA